jgi:hypothetical protein
LLNHTGAEDWQIVKEMAVSFENGPELAWHRQDEACIRDVEQGRLLLFQPVKCAAVTATGTESRFAPVIATLLISVRGIHLPAESPGATIENGGKILTDRRTSPRPIPNVSTCFKDLF